MIWDLNVTSHLKTAIRSLLCIFVSVFVSASVTYKASNPRQASSLLLRGQGEIVCCRCPRDQRYYRARVIEVNTNLDMVQVMRA